MTTIRIRSSRGNYDALLAPRLLAHAGALVRRAGEFSDVYVISSPRVWRYWGSTLTQGIPGWSDKRKVLFDDSESKKSLATVEVIARQLVRAGADRRAVIVALGGGVVGDVAGFVAATYVRGVRLVHIPTTFVAQVDSCIGGKTGVDLPEGKNLIGAFYPPSQILADPETLATLPQREYRSGLYEVIKYGVIADAALFVYLCRNMPALLRRDPKALAYVIPRCMRIKADVVSRDERESGLRQILNFGHTLGHALESATYYRRFLHGEAIGWGMIAATLLAVAKNRLAERDAAAIIRLVSAVGQRPSLSGIRAARLPKILASDKKSRHGSVRWVLPKRIGRVEWGIELPWKLVAAAFAELPKVAASRTQATKQ